LVGAAFNHASSAGRAPEGEAIPVPEKKKMGKGVRKGLEE